jgi:4-amino-4-deoxy-L-arabinose transferase-like glycosyltransferase
VTASTPVAAGVPDEHAPAAKVLTWQPQRFWACLLAITGAGFALRLLYSLRVPTGLLSDGTFYHEQANLLASGHGFVQPFVFTFEGASAQTAIHPPLWSSALAVASWFGFNGVDSHRVFSCFIGAGAVLVVGLVGRRLGGPRAGVIAAAFAAVYPNFWLGDGMLEPTSLYLLLIALLLLAAYAWLDRPTFLGAAAIGAVISLTSLARAETLGLFALLVLPMILLRRDLDLRRRLAMLATALVVGGVVLLPWFVYNTTRFERPVLLSTNGDYTLAAAYCDPAYSGRLVGFNDPFSCVPGPHLRPTPDYPSATEDESVWAERLRGQWTGYLFDHLDQLPRVVAARVGRVWDIYRPSQNIDLDALAGRNKRVAWWGEIVYWATIPFAIAGAFVLKRRGRQILPLVALVVLVTLAAAASYGEIRLRAGAEVALVLLAAAALTRLTGPLSPRGTRDDETDDGPSDTGDPTETGQQPAQPDPALVE